MPTAKILTRNSGKKVSGEKSTPIPVAEKLITLESFTGDVLERFFLHGLFRFLRVVNFIVFSSRIQTYLSAIREPALGLHDVRGVSE